MTIGNITQITSGPKRGQKGNGIRTRVRTKGPQWKKSHEMLPKCGVSTTKSWVTSLRTTKRYNKVGHKGDLSQMQM